MPQIMMRQAPEEDAEDIDEQQALVLEAGQQEEQLVAVAVVNDNPPFRHPRITMDGPVTILSRQPYRGNIEAAKMDERYVQMEKEVARFVWKDEDDQKIANALVASLVDDLANLDLRSFVCIPGISQRLKGMLKNRLEEKKQEEHERYLVYKEEKRFKG